MSSQTIEATTSHPIAESTLPGRAAYVSFFLSWSALSTANG